MHVDGFRFDLAASLAHRKHNEANGEDNRDGADDNRSWNSGAEGPAHPRGQVTAVLRGCTVRAAVTWVTVTGLSLRRARGQVQGAGGLLASRAVPGHLDRGARPEPGQEAGQAVG